MIAIDTSSLIAFFEGERGKDVDKLDQALEQKQAVIPPIVLTEILSLPELSLTIREIIFQIPVIELQEGFWLRAGSSRAKVLEKGLKAHLADILIAQSCIDERIALITRDADFQRYVKLCGLQLA